MTDEEKEIMIALCRFASGQSTFSDMAKFKEIVEADKTAKNIKQAVVEDVKCPECGGPMASRSGQYGNFWGCKKYPSCRGTRDSMGRSKAEREAEKEKGKEKEKELPGDNDKYRFRRE